MCVGVVAVWLSCSTETGHGSREGGLDSRLVGSCAVRGLGCEGPSGLGGRSVLEDVAREADVAQIVEGGPSV